MKRRLAALVLLWLAAAAHAQVSARDDRGATLTLAAPPQRIVSLLPSLTESVCALGACDRLVGTDKFSNWPAPVRTLPKLGGLEDAQIERIAALHPDVVMVSSSARIVDRLEALGLKVLVLDSDRHADVKRSLVAIARLLGKPDAADRVWAAIERELQAARARVPAALRGRSVYFEIDPTPYAAGAGSFIGETLSSLGLANALPAALGPFPKLNPEYVLRLQPDLLMAARPALDEMRARPGWTALRALHDGRSCGFAGDRYELLIRPGPRLGEAAGVIVDCLVGIAARADPAAPR
ncbi:MAG TPA: helical backbone metal receptor [Burkholderiaceae bacterium]|nr:helical backbone metal receptor [Burkholderiaceae bacterium]